LACTGRGDDAQSRSLALRFESLFQRLLFFEQGKAVGAGHLAPVLSIILAQALPTTSQAPGTTMIHQREAAGQESLVPTITDTCGSPTEKKNAGLRSPRRSGWGIPFEKRPVTSNLIFSLHHK